MSNLYLVLIKDIDEPIRVSYRVISTRKTAQEIADTFIDKGRNVVAVYTLIPEQIERRKTGVHTN